MGEKHRVRFEPVGLEIDVDEDETVLNAAFRQGVMLMHGCKEGQCSACKSFLLDGDLQMDRYSTFALADYESEEGYVLLCRSHAYSDLEVELLNFDEDMIRSGLPVVTFETRVESLEDVAPDITRLRLRLDDPELFRFHPGQYVDLTIPGTSDHRSFSMANTSGDLEFFIKRYPGGRFSGLLQDGLAVGDRLTATGPYGTFTLRVSSDRPLVFVGGGAGMAPILALLRQMVESRTERGAVYYYGARTAADLICAAEIEAIGADLENFRFVPCLSESWPDDWDGETGLVTTVLDRREPDLDDRDVYLCGPPPMIDAGLALLESRSVPSEQVFYDKFTLTGPTE
ncbi:FAD-binding oxidoreductase [Cryptosporangium aurantiacum]|uniref:Propane monooxygenase reductase subunit n=1 Tax=Cryptosporangium aurantiacum TaxID=134849 RepID=A0A1M7KRZ6_9ACTN|nr:FAD-binding oxidoreductase [Cryptosporangium aurantiacum]SHM68238.1 propane monooxygenase reductase subunit [Cryptosporangium aurantiacum]